MTKKQTNGSTKYTLIAQVNRYLTIQSLVTLQHATQCTSATVPTLPSTANSYGRKSLKISDYRNFTTEKQFSSATNEHFIPNKHTGCKQPIDTLRFRLLLHYSTQHRLHRPPYQHYQKHQMLTAEQCHAITDDRNFTTQIQCSSSTP